MQTFVSGGEVNLTTNKSTHFMNPFAAIEETSANGHEHITYLVIVLHSSGAGKRKVPSPGASGSSCPLVARLPEIDKATPGPVSITFSLQRFHRLFQGKQNCKCP